MGVRRRWDRSATSSRSAASSSTMRSASRLRVSPTSTISGGPAGSTRASRSPAPSCSAVRASSATGRTTPRATRSAASTTTTSRARLSTASRIQADATPWSQGGIGHEHRDHVDRAVGHHHRHQHPLAAPHADGRWPAAGPAPRPRRPGPGARAPGRRASMTDTWAAPLALRPWTTRPASDGATDSTGSSAWADRWAATTARSWATRWMSRPSGMTKARMMVRVMAAAPDDQPAPARSGLGIDQLDARHHGWCGGSGARPRSRPACGATTTGARPPSCPPRRRAGARWSPSSWRLVTTWPAWAAR